MKIFKKYLAAALIFSSLMVKPLSAQLEEINFIRGPISDAEILMQEYLRPYMNIIGANLNAGWYNTARPHKLGGLDITATVSVAFAPTSALQYDVAMLTGISANVEGSDVAPTVAGDMAQRPELVYNTQITDGSSQVQTVELARLTHPNGTGVEFLPLPMAQMSVGLPFGTEVTGRYVPSIDIGNELGEIGLWGVGGKHSISQWIPVLKRLKFIDISVQGGFTKVSSAVRLGLEPLDGVIAPVDAPAFWDDQYLMMEIQGWTVNLIASQTIPVVTLYQGIGYSSSIVELAMTGHYPVSSVISDPLDPNFGEPTYIVSENPIDELKFENYKNLRLNAGIRFKLGLLTLHYDFTRTLYSTHTVGLGISFR